MATATGDTDQIIIELIVEDASLDAANKKLSQFGKTDQQNGNILSKTNQELAERNQLYAVQHTHQQKAQAGAKAFVGTLGDLDKKTKAVIQQFIEGFLEEAQKELREVRLEMEKLRTSTGKTGEASKNLRTEMKNLTADMVKMKMAGQGNTEEYARMRARLGDLKDTIADVGAEAKTTGSDTRVFDGLLSAAQGVAAGFAVAQGTMALFGDESEETQKTLLKVNAAMAILQGLQQIQATLQKESAASLLLLNNAQKTNVVTTQLAIGAESKNIVVKTASAAASRALAFAMSLANPVMLAVVAVVGAVVAAYRIFTREAREAAEAQELMNLKMDATIEIAKEFDAATKRAGEKRVQDLKEQGASEQKIRAEQLKTLYELRRDNNQRILDRESEFNYVLDRLRESNDDDERKRLEEYKKNYESMQQNVIDLGHEIYLKESEDRILTTKEEKEALKEREENNKAFRLKERAAEKELLEQQLAGLQAQQFGLDANSQAWHKLQFEIIEVTGKLAVFDLVGNKALLEMKKNAEAVHQQWVNMMQTVSNQDNFSKAITDGVDDLVPKTISAFGAIQAGAKTMSKGTQQTFEEMWANNLASIEKFVGDAANIYGQLSSSINNLANEKQRNDEIRLENEKKRVEQELALGLITQKAAEQRNQKIEQQARALARQQAQRDKITAIFSAAVNTAQAVTKALGSAAPPYNFILAAAVGAAGLLQINQIRQRPLPALYRGKKRGETFAGMAQISEHGPEIIEREGRLFVEPKRTVAMIGRDDVVYTASESKKILDARGLIVANGQIHRKPSSGAHTASPFDYNALGSVISNNTNKLDLSIDKDGFNVSVKKGLLRIEYLDKRRQFRI